MDNLYKLILFLALLFFFNLANADTYPAQDGWQSNSSPIRSTFQAACADVGTNGYPYPYQYNSAGPACVETWDGTSNFASGNIRATKNLNHYIQNQCPAGGTLVGTNCIVAACVLLNSD